jgi:hypothetical protein
MATIILEGNIVKEVKNENGYLNFSVSENTGSYQEPKYSYYDCSMKTDKFSQKQVACIKPGAILKITGKYSSTVREYEGKRYTNWRVYIVDFEPNGSVYKKDNAEQ